MKGQGSTEYLVILAVVLVVALIVIGLLGQFTGFGSAGLEQQSKAYWQGASPFAILNARINSTSVQLEMQNKLTQRLTLKSITFDGNSINTTLGSMVFAPNQVRVVTGDNSPCTGGTGSIYQVDSVVITYDTAGLTNQVQVGDKPLYGKCA